MLWGDRYLNIDGNMTFLDEENGIKAVLFFQNGGFDRYKGILYKCNKSIPPLRKEPKQVKDLKDIEEIICEIEGSWLSSLNIGGIEYWNIDKAEPKRPIPLPNALPSDVRFREDLLWLKKGNEQDA